MKTHLTLSSSNFGSKVMTITFLISAGSDDLIQLVVEFDVWWTQDLYIHHDRTKALEAESEGLEVLVSGVRLEVLVEDSASLYGMLLRER